MNSKASPAMSGERRPLALVAALTIASAVAAFVVGPAFPANADKNDFNIDFAAAAPGTYNTATGGGAYDSGSNGTDIVDSLASGSIFCGEIVSYLVQIVVDSDAVGAQTLTFDYTFAVEGTNGNRAGHIDIVGLPVVNYFSTEGEGAGGLDSGISDDGGSVISSITEVYEVGGENPPTTAFPATSEELNLTFDIDDLEASESVVLRIDVLVECDAGAGTGLVQASQNGVSLGDVAVPGGGETIPMVGCCTAVTTTTGAPTTTTGAPTTTTGAPTTTTGAPTTTTGAPTTTTGAPTTTTGAPTTSTGAPTTTTGAPTTTTTLAATSSTLPITGVGDFIRVSAPLGLGLLLAGVVALGGAALVGDRRRNV